jgi:hypothetical protein
MLSFAFPKLLLTTDSSSTISSSAIANAYSQLNAIKKSTKKTKSKKGDQIHKAFSLKSK